MQKMDAAKLYGREDLPVERTDIPRINSNEILTKIEAATICASDIRAFLHGNGRVKLPRILGHEFAGRIVKVGSNLKRHFEVGSTIHKYKKVSDRGAYNL